MSDDLRERVAQVMAKADGCIWDHMSRKHQAEYLGRADAALAEIGGVREAARVLLDAWMTAKIPSAAMTLFLKGQPHAGFRAIAEGKDHG